MDNLEKNIRKLREYDHLGESIHAIEMLVEEVLRNQEAQALTCNKSPEETALTA